MRSLYKKRPLTPYNPRTFTLAALAFLALLALVFASFEPGSVGRDVVTGIAYFFGAALAVFALWHAILPAAGRERMLWALFAGGLLLRFTGDLSWLLLREFAPGYVPSVQVLYIASYLVLACGLLSLVSLMTNRIARVTALDALTIVASVGSLVYFFVLDRPGVRAESLQESLALLIHPSFDAALLFLGLVAFSAGHRSTLTGFLTLGFLVFLLGDAVYLFSLRASGATYDPGSWSGMLLAAGTLLVGLGVLHAPEAFESRANIDPWRVFVFWIGPLSPSVHYAFLMIWGVFYPPLPTYVYAIGALILLCMGLRVALVSFVTRENTRDQEDTARELEQNRLLRELHETTKQDVHGISLALGSAMEAERQGERYTVQKTLDRAFRLARESEYRISRPYEDLRDSQRESRISPDEYLRGRLAKFEEYFNIKTQEDLQAPLDVLSQDEVAGVNRVVVEAFWNVAKHSRARNLYLESRRVGRVLIIRVRDDGRGFDPGKSSSGMGLQYIQRAAEVGATLDVISGPGRGTNIELRFEKK